MGQKSTEPTTEPVSIWISLDLHGTRRSRVIQCRGWYRSAAQAGEVMAAKFVADGSLLPRGCIDSNEAFTLSDIEPQLAELNGLSILAQEENAALGPLKMTPTHLA